MIAMRVNKSLTMNVPTLVASVSFSLQFCGRGVSKHHQGSRILAPSDSFHCIRLVLAQSQHLLKAPIVRGVLRSPGEPVLTLHHVHYPGH